MNRYLHIFTLGILVALTSCVKTDIDFGNVTLVNPSSDSAIHIFGAVEDYDIKHVGTRAEGDEISDSFISEMTMFIFKANGDIIQGYKTRNATFDADGNLTAVNFDGCETCSSAINIQKANPTFLVDTEDGIIASYEGEKQTLIYYDNFANDLQGCQIYIVANAYHQLESELGTITTLEKLKTFELDIDNTLAMPMIDETHPRGFPMIGTPLTAKFNLKKGDKNDVSVANIPLKKLYSKVRFTLQVCAHQVVSNQIPSFEISRVEVFNVPTKARLGRDLDPVTGKPIYGEPDDNSDDYINEVADGSISGNIGEYYQFTGSEPFVIKTFDNNHTITTHNPSVDQTDDRIEFGFYMPEHKVTPNSITYPSGMPQDCYQYYKPKGVGASRDESGLVTLAKIATYVRIHGQYTDHNGQIKDVRYDIYLGQDEVDDFTVKRNQLLNNQLVITGVTNYYNAYGDVADNISIDHRVAVDYTGFNLSMERTAILDSHFEVRPLDVTLSPGSSMTITIPEGYRDWVAMESDQDVRKNYDDKIYISDEEGSAVRKYFTDGLVAELNGTSGRGNGGTITLSHSNKEKKTETYRIWFYVDENPNVYDKLLGESLDKGGITSSPTDGKYQVYGKNDTNPMYRVCPVKFQYYGTDNDNAGGGAATVSKTVTVNLQQWNLWRVWGGISKNRYYDIEHEEEYLNNYVSDDIYGQTQEGMPWGLDGVQLSNRIQAIKIEESTGFINFINGIGKYLGWDLNGMYTNVIQGMKNAKYYDFYLTRDGWILADGEKAEDYKRDYSGFIFNEEIATILKKNYATQQVAHTEDQGYLAQIEKLNLTQSPSSAFAYCYHKNKRNNDGEVVEQKWFLPAIDEIEDIALGAYDEFDRVFQNKKYWSCQPAYDKNRLSMDVMVSGWNPGDVLADYYSDDLDRARATSVYTTNGVNYQNIDSGVPGYAGTQGGTVDWTTPSFGNYISNTLDFSDYPGNLPRTESCRIRAVYRSGTVQSN